jgi:hypothetical protein
MEQDRSLKKLPSVLEHTKALSTSFLAPSCHDVYFFYKGKESKPSIVMESIADYFLFLWHASYGYTGTFNDNTILHLSPFMDRLLDGTFHELEAEAAVVPFMIKEEQFNKVFVLVDGIYPS